MASPEHGGFPPEQPPPHERRPRLWYDAARFPDQAVAYAVYTKAQDAIAEEATARAEEANRARLRSEISGRFGGRGPVPITDMERWISGDSTDYHVGHLRKTLREMEAAGMVTVPVRPDGKKRRGGAFPEGTTVEVRATESGD